MATAQELTKSALTKIESQQCSPTQTTQAGSKGSSQTKNQEIWELVNRAFTRLEAIYPGTWRRAFSTPDMVKLAKREMGTSMAKWSTLPTTKSLDAALERIKDEGGEWPPSVARLIASLRPQPEDFGMPNVEVAFNEAIQNAQNPGGHKWSHAAVREAGQAAGWFDLAQASSESRIRALRSIFRKHYYAVVNRVMAGGQVEARALVGNDRQLTPAQIAERNGRESAQQRAEDAGIPSSMSSEQGLRSLRAALGGR
ncbi:replication protein P [Vreelandella titanicae]|uniref:replication protein P n=1 Tax=Vreelandella titanicae TaxID=664683 RepID=UPI002166973E|nr:replication protein P [Halomonas titanicae]